jgi:hypothetical protein
VRVLRGIVVSVYCAGLAMRCACCLGLIRGKTKAAESVNLGGYYQSDFRQCRFSFQLLDLLRGQSVVFGDISE